MAKHHKLKQHEHKFAAEVEQRRNFRVGLAVIVTVIVIIGAVIYFI